MELTTEQIARVFAMYWGCLCTSERYPQIKGNISGIDNCMAGLHVFIDNNEGVPIDEAKLVLRPLSAITDEDAIEVARIMGVTYSADPSSEAFFDYDGLMCYVVELFTKGGNMREIPADKVVEAFQFLIQQGYAVPLFIAPDHPCNGMTAIQLGLAIDSTTLP